MGRGRKRGRTVSSRALDLATAEQQRNDGSREHNGFFEFTTAVITGGEVYKYSTYSSTNKDQLSRNERK